MCRAMLVTIWNLRQDYEETEGKAVIEVRSFKVCELPENPPFPSSIDMMTDPPLSTVGIFEYEIPEGWGNAAEGEE